MIVQNVSYKTLNKMTKDTLEFKMAKFVERRNIECRFLGLSAKFDGDYDVSYESYRGQSSFLVQFTYDV